jgi:hypothetical protein
MVDTTYTIKPGWGTNNVNSYVLAIIPCYGAEQGVIAETPLVQQIAAATSASLSYSGIPAPDTFRLAVHALARRGNAAASALTMTILPPPGTTGAGQQVEGQSSAAQIDGDMRFVIGSAMGVAGGANTATVDFAGQSKESAAVSFAFTPTFLSTNVT